MKAWLFLPPFLLSILLPLLAQAQVVRKFYQEDELQLSALAEAGLGQRGVAYGRAGYSRSLVSTGGLRLGYAQWLGANWQLGGHLLYHTSLEAKSVDQRFTPRVYVAHKGSIGRVLFFKRLALDRELDLSNQQNASLNNLWRFALVFDASFPFSIKSQNFRLGGSIEAFKEYDDDDSYDPQVLINFTRPRVDLTWLPNNQVAVTAFAMRQTRYVQTSFQGQNREQLNIITPTWGLEFRYAFHNKEGREPLPRYMHY